MNVWVNIALVAGGFAAVLLPTVAFVARHVSRSFDHKANAIVHAATEKITKKVDERLDQNDAVTEDIKIEVTKIKATVFPNGGSSMADRVRNIEVDVAKLRGAFEQANK